MALTAYQAHMKRELKGKMKGKTKAQRAAIFKAAAKSYKKGGTRSTPKSKSKGSKSKSLTKGGNKRMGKRGGFNTQKLFKIIRIGSLLVPAAHSVIRYGFTKAGGVAAIRYYFGMNVMDGKFSWQDLATGYMPYIAANIVTHGIPKIGSFIRSLLR